MYTLQLSWYLQKVIDITHPSLRRQQFCGTVGHLLLFCFLFSSLSVSLQQASWFSVEQRIFLKYIVIAQELALSFRDISSNSAIRVLDGYWWAYKLVMPRGTVSLEWVSNCFNLSMRAGEFYVTRTGTTRTTTIKKWIYILPTNLAILAIHLLCLSLSKLSQNWI